MRKLILMVMLGLIVGISNQVFAVSGANSIDAYFTQTDIFIAPATSESLSLVTSYTIDSMTLANSYPTMETRGGTYVLTQFKSPRTVRLVINIFSTPLSSANTRTGYIYVKGWNAKGEQVTEKVRININSYSNTPNYGVSTVGAFSRIEKIYVDNALANSCAITDTFCAGIGRGLGLSNYFYQKINDTASLILVSENAVAIGGYNFKNAGIVIDYINGVWFPITIPDASKNYILRYKARLK
jgi:hypothetical protein